MVAEAASAQVGFERIEALRQFRGAVAVELDNQNRPGIALKEIAQSTRFRIEFRAIEDESIHDLDRGRLMHQDRRRGGKRFEQIRELHDEQRLRLGQFDKSEFRFEHDAERPFGADEEMSEIEWVFGVWCLVLGAWRVV